jgi:hypothetical protein
MPTGIEWTKLMMKLPILSIGSVLYLLGRQTGTLEKLEKYPKCVYHCFRRFLFVC